MSPNTLETQGLINQTEYQKVAALTHSASPEAQKKIAGNTEKLFGFTRFKYFTPQICY